MEMGREAGVVKITFYLMRHGARRDVYILLKRKKEREITYGPCSSKITLLKTRRESLKRSHTICGTSFTEE